MSDAGNIDWRGQSGKTYRYWFVDNNTAHGIKSEAGNYAFVKQIANGNYVPLYFGESNDLSDRIPGHDMWPEALRLGATGVMAHTTPSGQQTRLEEERDLIQYWNPALNTQHRRIG